MKNIKRLYKTGNYSLEMLAAEFHVAKGTVSNTLHDYPYTTNPETYRERVYRQMKINLSTAVDELSQVEIGAIKSGDILSHDIAQEQHRHIAKFAALGPDVMLDILKQERLVAEQNAWVALGKGTMMHYALYSGLWQMITDIIGDLAKNPFARAVDVQSAKRQENSVRYSGIRELSHTCEKPKKQIEGVAELTDRLWGEIGYFIECGNPRVGRPPKDMRKILSGLIFCLRNGVSIREASREGYGKFGRLARYWRLWWGSGLFTLLFQISANFPELQMIRGQLARMEQYRAEFPGKIPRIDEVQP
jgi:transposase